MLLLFNLWKTCLQIFLTDPEGFSRMTLFKLDFFDSFFWQVLKELYLE